MSEAVKMIPSTPFLRRIRAALLKDFEEELVLACRVAVLRACGFRHSEIARKLDAQPAQLRAAEARVKRAAESLDEGES